MLADLSLLSLMGVLQKQLNRSCVRDLFFPEIVVGVHDNFEISLWFFAHDIHTSGTTCHPIELEEGKSDGEKEDSDFCYKLHFPPSLNFHPHHFYIRILANRVARIDLKEQNKRGDKS